MEYLTVKEVAELKGCSIRYIRQLIQSQKLQAEETVNKQNNKKQYVIPVSALPEELQTKYYCKITKNAETKIPKKHKENIQKNIEDYSEEERKLIVTWSHIIEDWQNARLDKSKKTEYDKDYIGKLKIEHPDLKISIDILYRKYSAYKEKDWDGLIGKHGGHNKGQNSIPDEVWQGFLWYYLDQRKPTIARCYELTKEWTDEFYPEYSDKFPAYKTFYNHVKSDISKAVGIYMREGEKACTDRCVPYIMRMYDDLNANDVWIADNHTLDVQSVNENGVHRLYVTAFLDAKSGVMVGWNVTDTSNSQSTILALRHGIRRMGIPKIVYVDNGSEFLTHDFGGRGHRTTKNLADDPPTILEHLGITMRNAEVRNAKAKPIERTFYTLKNQFSKIWSGYCGGVITERPENLKRIIKNGELPRDFAVRDYIDKWMDGDYNLQEYGGNENKYKGMSRIDVWNKSIQDVGMRTASEADLNLMLARTTRYQKVKRNGVCIEVLGNQIWYTDIQMAWQMLDREVYVRYDPAELDTVRLYDKDTDKYIATWECADKLMIDYISTDKEEIAEGEAIQRKVKKYIREVSRGMTEGLTAEQKITALDMTIRRSKKRMQDFEIKKPSKIIPVYAKDKTDICVKRAVGAECEKIDIDLKRMAESAKKRKEN